MPVDDTDPRIQYTAPGGSHTYPVPFAFFDDTDLVMITTEGGVDTTRTLGSDYTVAGGDGSTGSATASFNAGATVTIYRDVPATQETEFEDGDPLPAPNLNDALDKLTMLAQQNREALDRAIVIDPTSTETPADLLAELLGSADTATAAATAAAASATAAAASAAIAAASVALAVAMQGWITGLGMVNGTDTQHDIDFQTGATIVAAAGTPYGLVNAAVMTKQLDAGWAAGTNKGGLFTSSIANSTWYHCFIIRKDSDGSVDFGFDTDIGAAHKPAGYSVARRIGSVLTDATPAILQFVQDGDQFWWKGLASLDVNVTNQSTTAVARQLTVPPGIRVRAMLNVFASHSTGSIVYLRPTETTDSAPSSTAAPLTNAGSTTLATPNLGSQVMILTDTSGQIASRATATNTVLRIQTVGYTDGRGK